MILLARHGETDDNLPPLRVQGSRDTPLNATGRRQAAELGERLRAERPRALYSSQLSRARDTALAVGAATGLGEPRIDRRLAEGNRGEWEGRLFDDIKREDPEGFAAWRRAGPDFRFPGGESLQEQAQRVAAALADIGQGPLPAVVVCHGGSIRTVLCARDPRGLSAFHEWDVPNGAVVRL